MAPAVTPLEELEVDERDVYSISSLEEQARAFRWLTRIAARTGSVTLEAPQRGGWLVQDGDRRRDDPAKGALDAVAIAAVRRGLIDRATHARTCALSVLPDNEEGGI